MAILTPRDFYLSGDSTLTVVPIQKGRDNVRNVTVDILINKRKITTIGILTVSLSEGEKTKHLIAKLDPKPIYTLLDDMKAWIITLPENNQIKGIKGKGSEATVAVDGQLKILNANRKPEVLDFGGSKTRYVRNQNKDGDTPQIFYACRNYNETKPMYKVTVNYPYLLVQGIINGIVLVNEPS